MQDGFPELTDSFLFGQDILYNQFNEINFYVEDTEQEHLYHQILKKIFPDVSFDKIFPLNGKTNVTNAAKYNVSEKNKVYIVDLDFDEILSKKHTVDNLFYLRRYSIENYLCNKHAIWEIIREKSPKLKDNDISNILDFNNICEQWKMLLSELSSIFLIIREKSLPIRYFGVNCPRDIELKNNPVQIKNNFISKYYDDVEALLKSLDSTYTLETEIQRKNLFFDSTDKVIENTPGKYLLTLLKFQLENLSLIDTVSLESFTYKLSKETDVSDLEFLKIDIENYIKT